MVLALLLGLTQITAGAKKHCLSAVMYIDLHDFGGNVLNLLFQGSNDIIDGLCTITLGPHLRKITCNVIRIRINCLRS